MHKLLLCTLTASALTLGTAAMAQSSVPVPNASGAQTTNPSSYGSQATEPRMAQSTPGKHHMKTSTKKHHASAQTKHHANAQTKQHASAQHHSMQKHHEVNTTGSIKRPANAMATPVPNASGSQVTNADTYRATAYQHRRH